MTQPEYIKTLIHWCEINSGSRHQHGLEIMRKTLRTTFSLFSDEVYDLTGVASETLPRPIPSLLFKIRPHLKRRILLCGHFDTVFHAHHPFQQVHPIHHHKLCGPGIADMKGGLMVVYMALNLLKKSPFASRLGIDVFMNADEEIGSLSSSIHFKAITQNIPIVLCYEPSLDEIGTLARQRKGNGHFTITAIGQAAHAGRDFEKGCNAIIGLTRALEKIYTLNGQKTGLTVNIGFIQGGEALNQVPAKAYATLEVRFSHPDHVHWIESAMQAICQEVSQGKLSLQLQGTFHRPLKVITPQTEALFQHTQTLAKSLHINLNWQDTGGCCDGNNFAALGLAVLDTLGVRGGCIHTDSEYVCHDSLQERALLSTKLIESLARGDLPEILP